MSSYTVVPVMIGPSLIVFDRFKSLSHPLKEEAVQWQTGFMATPRCFTYRLNLKKANISYRKSEMLQGWQHIGDSDSADGHLARFGEPDQEF